MRGSKKAKPAQVLLLFHKQPHLLGLREHILELLLLLRNGLLIVLRINPFNGYTPSVSESSTAPETGISPLPANQCSTHDAPFPKNTSRPSIDSIIASISAWSTSSFSRTHDEAEQELLFNCSIFLFSFRIWNMRAFFITRTSRVTHCFGFFAEMGIYAH